MRASRWSAFRISTRCCSPTESCQIARVWLDREAVALGERRDLLLDRARMQREARPGAAVVAEQHVLGDGERLDEPEVLVHHRDAGGERVARRREPDGLAPQLDRSGVGLVEAREDVREGALPRTVLAEQRVHLADGGLEVDGVVREHAGEALGDPAHRHRGGRAAPRGGICPFAQDLTVPMTPWTSQFMAYSCFTESFVPFGTRTLPA